MSKKKQKVAYFSLEQWQKEYLKNSKKFQGLNIEPVFIDSKLDSKNLPDSRDFDAISVFVDSAVDKKVLRSLKDLKFVETRSTGYDHIDLKECEKKGIKVSYSPSYGERTVAEFTFALILTLTRKVAESYDRIRETGSFSLEGFRGVDLAGKTLGVIGTGRIGRNVIHIANGFDMDIVAYDLYPNSALAKEMNFSYMTFEDVLKNSDVITLHVPYMPETHHLINKESIRMIKKGALLINTSRGGVIETESLVRALKDGHLGGAGLDVLEEEGAIKDEMELLMDLHPQETDLRTLLANHVLIDMPNVIITPHNAFNTWEALERILDTSIANIGGFLKKKYVNLIK